MTISLQRGANAALSSLLQGGKRLDLLLEWGGDSPVKPSVDVLAFLLDAAGRVSADEDMIFYNNMKGQGGAVTLGSLGQRHGLAQQSLALDLARLSPATERIAVCLALHEELGGITAIGQLNPVRGRVQMAGEDQVVYELATATPEAALIFLELYKRNGEWKIKAVGQGYKDGLARLAESYGVAIAQEQQASVPQPPSPQKASPPIEVGPSVTPPILVDPLGKDGFGEIQVHLTWSAPKITPEAQPKAGLLGGLLQQAKGARPPAALDLDLCALYELHDGYRGVSVAGGSLGGYNAAPFVQLMGDAKAGANTSDPVGETLRINGARWQEIRRILVYASIFQGKPNWAQAMGRASIRVRDALPIGVRLDQNETDKRACSIALIEFVDGKMAIHKRVETFKTPRELDEHYHWGLRWTTGAKD